MRTHVDRMLDALTYDGPSRLRKAWLGFLATYYSYTRSWHGAEGPDGKPMDFGRWYSFCCAARVFFDWLVRRDR